MVNTNITNACAAGQWQALTRQEKKELANYHRASFGSPTNQHPFKQCMRTLSTFPGLTTDLISKHLSPIIAIALGHQDQEAKPLRSTNPSTPEVTINQPDTDLAPDAESRTSVICSMVFSTESLHSYSDQTGKFPVRSLWGKYFFFIIMTPTLYMLSQFRIAKQPCSGIQYSALQRVSNPAPHFRQRVFSGSENIILQTQHQLSAGSTSRALSHLHIQKQLHCNTEHS